MRANLRAGKLHPEPRSVEHARRRVQQLDHEIEGIMLARARKREGKPSRVEEDLQQERALTVTWIAKHTEAMPMSAKKTEKIETELTQHDMHTIICALRTAAERYDADSQTFRQVQEDIRNGKAVPMFVQGNAGIEAAKRLADQFYRQAQDTRAVLNKLENGEHGDGTVSR